jgi:glycosyltransferase involved in cell wall biosynthesis
MSQRQVCIIIPTKDRKSVFEETLSNAYAALTDLNGEIIVINDSKQNPVNIHEQYRDKVRVFSNPKSGVASARNYGASLSDAQFLLFIDDDILISKNNLSDTFSFFNSHPAEKACFILNWKYPATLESKLQKTSFGRYLTHYGFTSLEGKGWMNHEFINRNDFQQIPAAASFYFAIPKNIFDELGGYSEGFSFSGFEDYDWAVRLKGHDVHTYILPSGLVFHNESDRLELKQWMERRIRAGFTRKQAVEAGYKELMLKNNLFKHSIYKVMVLCKPVAFLFQKIIPNYSFFDFIYFRLVNLLLGISIFEGYYYGKKIHKRN